MFYPYMMQFRRHHCLACGREQLFWSGRSTFWKTCTFWSCSKRDTDLKNRFQSARLACASIILSFLPSLSGSSDALRVSFPCHSDILVILSHDLSSPNMLEINYRIAAFSDRCRYPRSRSSPTLTLIFSSLLPVSLTVSLSFHAPPSLLGVMISSVIFSDLFPFFPILSPP